MKAKLLKDIDFMDFLRITFELKMFVLGPEDNYINGAYICAWCRHKIYIGEPYKKVPEDLRAWFMPPRQFEELRKIIEEGEQ